MDSVWLARPAPASSTPRPSARRWLAATLLAGVVLGAVQTMRGAHYVIHSLGTAGLCWRSTLAVMRAPAPSPSAA